ncbi:MAG TPA: hypothetical protein VMR34_04270 [Candidatus Saccharimonadales bacterium]|nr:hypothetical protein [Candidatus Saccharimonadales bacterium]
MSDKDPQPGNPGTNLAQVFDQIAEKIIEQQEAIIGPIAVEQAKKVPAIKLDWAQHGVDINGDPQKAIDDLIQQFKELFGQIAVETCREAVSKILPLLPSDKVPASLK